MVTLIRVIVAAVTATCWLMSIYKLRDLSRDPGNRSLRALCTALVAITLSLTIQPIAPHLDRVIGVLDVGRVVSNCLTLIAAGAAQGFLLYMTSQDDSIRRRVRRRYRATAICVVAIVVLFVTTPAPYQVSDPYVQAGDYYTANPTSAATAYTLIYLIYLGWALTQVTVLATRYAAIANRPLLHFGLRMIVIGATLGLAYIAAKIATIGAAFLGWGDPAVFEPVVIVLFTTSILLVLLGSTLPSWGPRLGLHRLWEWSTAVRARGKLRPLWLAMHAVIPEIALVPQQTAWWQTFSPRQASLRRIRTTVEILDGYILLRPWMTAPAAATARRLAAEAGLIGDDAEAVVDAALIATALHARQNGQPPPPDHPDPDWIPLHERQRGEHAAAQEAWLARIADAYPSPVVHAVLQSHRSPASQPSVHSPSERED